MVEQALPPDAAGFASNQILLAAEGTNERERGDVILPARSLALNAVHR
jgi:hypothetical protein